MLALLIVGALLIVVSAIFAAGFYTAAALRQGKQNPKEEKTEPTQTPLNHTNVFLSGTGKIHLQPHIKKCNAVMAPNEILMLIPPSGWCKTCARSLAEGRSYFRLEARP